jgi:hypothetical protein
LRLCVSVGSCVLAASPRDLNVLILSLRNLQVEMPRTRELLAVPFIGKDVPSRSSEFAHPEVNLSDLPCCAAPMQLRVSVVVVCARLRSAANRSCLVLTIFCRTSRLNQYFTPFLRHQVLIGLSILAARYEGLRRENLLDVVKQLKKQARSS